MRRPNGEPSIEPVVELQRETYGVGKILRGLNVALKLCRALREYKFEDTRSYRLYTCRGLVCLFSQSLCHDQGLMLCYHGHVLSKLLYFYNLPFLGHASELWDLQTPSFLQSQIPHLYWNLQALMLTLL